MKQICKKCAGSFEIRDEDLKFYDKVSPVFNGKKYQIPSPILCPDCRQQVRQAFRNERRLYNRKCDLCSKDIISMFRTGTPYKVYCPECYFSDKWDAHTYGVTYDFNKTFSEQYQALMIAVPQLSLNVVSNENSEYINMSGYNKNCYLLFAGEYNENVYYAENTIKSTNCCDTTQTFNSELIHNSVEIEECYNLGFSVNCKTCRDSNFLYDCIGCSDCIMCSNLRTAQYCIRNKKMSKEQYVNEKDKILGAMMSYRSMEALKNEFFDMMKNSIHRYGVVINTQDSYGNYLINAKNCYASFEVTKGEDCTYTYDGFDVKDLMDITNTTEAELALEGMSIGYRSYNTLFSYGIWSSSDIYYSSTIKNSQNLLGCINMVKAQYCIFNKQYTKQEYEALVPKIIEQMQKTGEWGMFFSPSLSPFGYNETMASIYFPLSCEEALQKGFSWCDEEAPFPKVERVITADQIHKLPDNIKDIPDDILNWALTCEVTNKPYRIIKQELAFYRKHNLPIPRRHPDQRHKDRMALRNPRKLYERTCMKCNKPIQTTYAPDRPEIVYCETCYLNEVY